MTRCAHIQLYLGFHREDLVINICWSRPYQDGGFYSAEDADSFPSEADQHKKEGAFCVWMESDIRRLLTDKLPGQPEKTAADLFVHHYGVKKNGNVDPKQVWECGSKTGMGGLWIQTRYRNVDLKQVWECGSKTGMGMWVQNTYGREPDSRILSYVEVVAM